MIGWIVGVHRNLGQPGTKDKRPLTDGGDAIGDRDARQAGARRKREVADGGNTVGDRIGVTCFSCWIENDCGLILRE